MGKEIKRKISQEVSVLVEDFVSKLEKTNGGYRIRFSVHSGIYYLKKGSKDFDTILKSLKHSKNVGKELILKVDSTTLEIKEIIAGTD